MQLRDIADETHDREMRNLERKIQVAEEACKKMLLRKGDEAEQHKIEKARLARLELEALQEAARETARRKAEAEERERLQRLAEEKQGAETVKMVSTPCPDCRAPVQRKSGW